MTRRARRALALVGVFVGALVITAGACGGDDDDDVGTPPPTLPTAAPCTDSIERMARASDLEYRAGAPEKTTLLEPGVDGDRLVIQGYVLFPDCRAVDGAVLDVWQADADGAYAPDGYELRGVFRSDEFGRYQIETIVPGDGVVHVKAAEAVGGRIVTVAIDVPDDPDPVFRQDLVLELG